jgi:hypothetical protein
MLRSPVAHGKQALARGEAPCSQGAHQRNARARRPRRLASGTPAPGRRSHSSQHHDPRAPSPIDSTPSRATTGRTGASSARPPRTWAVTRHGAGSSGGKTAASTMTTEEPPSPLGTRSERRAQPAGRQCPPRPRAKTPVARPTITVQLPSTTLAAATRPSLECAPAHEPWDTSQTSPQRHNLARINFCSSARAVTARVPATGDSVPPAASSALLDWPRRRPPAPRRHDRPASAVLRRIPLCAAKPRARRPWASANGKAGDARRSCLAKTPATTSAARDRTPSESAVGTHVRWSPQHARRRRLQRTARGKRSMLARPDDSDSLHPSA